MNHHKEALNNLLKWNEMTSGDDLFPNLFYLANSYLNSGDISNSEILNEIIYKEWGLTNLTAEICLAKGKYREAAENLMKATKMSDEHYKKATTQKISLIVSSYYDNKLNFFKQQIQNIKHNWAIFTVLFIAFISFIFFLIIKWHKTKDTKFEALISDLRKELIEQSSAYIELKNIHEEILNEKPNEYNDNKLLIRNLSSLLYEPISNLLLSLENQSSKNLESKTKLKLETIFASFRYGKPKFNEIVDIVNKTYDNLYDSFVEDFPNTKPNYREIFLYFAIGLNISTIQIVLNSQQKYIYNIKYELKKKITNSDSKNKQKYLVLLS